MNERKDKLHRLERELTECSKDLQRTSEERIQLEAKLNKTQFFMDAVFESIQEGISILNPDLTIRFANKVMKNWYPQEESLIGKKCFWCYHHQTEPCNPCPAIRCMKTGKTESNVVPGIPGSDIEWVEVFAYPIKDKDAEEVNGIIEFVRDITNQKKTEEKLEQSESYYRSLLNSVSDIIVEISEEGIQKFISPAVEKFTGYKPEELKKPFSKVIHPEDLGKVLEIWQNSLYDYGTLYKVEYRHIHKTKGYIWAEANASSFLNDPAINSVIVSVRDISERKYAEDELAKSKSRYKALSNAASEMLALEDLSDIYNYISEKMHEHFPQSITIFVTVDEEKSTSRLININGLDDTLLAKAFKISGENIIGNTFRLLPGHYKKYKTGRLSHFEGGLADFAGPEFPAIAANGIQKLLEIRDIYAIGINKDDKLYAILHFFTMKEDYPVDSYFVESFIKQAGIIIDRKIMEIALKESESRLRSLNLTKDKLFSIIGHDLKNPLSNIIGFTGLLQSNDYKPSEVVDINRHIHKSARAMADLLESLLQWSRTQQDNHNILPQRINIGEIAGKCIDLMMASATAKDIDVTTDIEKDSTAVGDKEMITTVIRNLVSNAIKFTWSGGKIHVGYRKKGKCAIISVSDTGVGIKNTRNLFALDQTTTTKGTAGESGTGLGLVICKEFIEKNQGDIWVNSKPGKGTTFYFSLPLE